MRGRTNIGGGGIALNATVQQKTIKSGNIIAGDFVEYFSQTPYIAQSSDINFKFAFKGYSIGITGGVMTAFKNGEAVDSFADYNCTWIGKDDSDNFIVFHDNNLGILGTLNIVNDEIILVDTLQTSDISQPQIGIGIGGGKVCYVKRGNSSPYYTKVGVANISANGELSNFVLTTIEDSSYVLNNGEPNIITVAYYNGFYFVYRTSSWRTAHIEIDSNNVASFSSPTSIINNLYDPRLIYKKDNIIVIACLTNSNIGCMYIINFVTGNYMQKIMPEDGEIYSFINEGKFLASGKNTFWIKYSSSGSTSITLAYKLKLYAFNERTYEISLIDEIVLEDDYTEYPHDNLPYNVFIQSRDLSDYEFKRNIAAIDNGYFYAQVKGQITSTQSSSPYMTYNWSKNIYLYEIANGKLTEITDHNYVRPYQAGNPIGVAKDSGMTNDIIDVYIPAVSS